MQASAPSDQYLCAFILSVLLIFFLYFEQFLDFRFTRRPYCLFIIVCYVSQIAEKQEQITTLTTEIASIQKAIEEQKNTLKEKKTALKKAEKEVASLESKKTKADAKAAEEAKKTEAEAVLKKLLASGMSADEILEKLK